MDQPAPEHVHRRARQPPFQRRRIAEQDLIYEIERAARAIADARDFAGRPVFRTDGVWRVLTTVAHSDYCLAIADHQLAATTHVVRVVRQRLERDAREWAQLKKGERTMR